MKGQEDVWTHIMYFDKCEIHFIRKFSKTAYNLSLDLWLWILYISDCGFVSFVECVNIFTNQFQ